MMGILTLLIKWVPLCQIITLVAVKGKPGGGSDAEIKFIEELLPRVGARKDEEYQGTDCGKYLLWYWDITRPDGSVCNVNLYQYKKSEDADMELEFWPQKEFSAAPNLKRGAVVSAPATSKGVSVATLLNEKVAESLSRAVDKAEKCGWMPNWNGFRGADGKFDRAAYNEAVDAWQALAQ